MQGHKNGVTSLSIVNGKLLSGSFDHWLIVWNLQEIELRIIEKQKMMAEDLRSKKFEAFENFMESKGKRKKQKGKKAKKVKK